MYMNMDETQPIIGRQSLFNTNNYDCLLPSEYQEDYKSVIRRREMFRIPFFHQSPQISYRKDIVDYLKNFAAEKQISYSCLHLAIYMLDIIMDNHSIVPERLKLVGNVSLLLAAKFEEITVNIPKLEELNAAVGNRYTINDYKSVEIIILKFFHWYLILPTPAHYTHYFMQVILNPQDLMNETRPYQTLIIELHEFIRIYLDKVIDDIHFMQLYTPSRLAAAIISAARKQLGLESWSEQLKIFTEYSKEQIYEPVHALIKSDCITCSGCTKRKPIHTTID